LFMQIKAVRQSVGKTQKEFGKSLGVSRDTLASYESGRVIPSETFVQLLCTTYGVNADWLRTGAGEMYIDSGNDFLKTLQHRYSLDDTDMEILSLYLKTPLEYREIFRFYVKGLVETGYKQYLKENPLHENQSVNQPSVEDAEAAYKKTVLNSAPSTDSTVSSITKDMKANKAKEA
jgi:transcriptional regulator with XRE-family HTH domain